MPQIPTLNRSALNQAPTARVSPVGESLVSAGSVFTQIAVQEQAMVRNLKSAEMTRGLRGDIEDVAAGFDNRVDYENFDDDYDKAINELNAKWSDFAGGDRQLQNAFQVAFQDASLDLKKVVRAKKYQVIREAAKGEKEAQYNQALDDYAGSSDSSERQAIRTNLEIIANSFAKDHLLTAEEVVGLMEDFDNNAESARADMMIYDDPEEALKMLDNKEFDLSPKLRQQKKEDAVRRIKEQKTAARVAADAEKKRIEEALQKAHDEEEKEIGNLFIKGDYEQALKLIQDSQLLEGGEKRTWQNAVINAVQKGIDTTDYVYLNEQLVKAVSGEIVNPDAVIPVAGKLTKENAEYIRTVAQRANDPTTKTVNTLEEKALRTVQDLAKEGSTFFGYTVKSEEDAYNAFVALKLVLDAEKDPRKKIDMLDPTSPNYIVMKTVAPYIKKTDSLQNANDIIDILKGIDTPEKPNSDTEGLTNYHYNPKTKETIGWDGSKWVTVKTK